MRLTPRIAALPTISEALVSCQKAHRWNQSQMANELGLGRGHYSEVLSGKRRLPYEAACKAYGLGVSAKTLLALHNITKLRNKTFENAKKSPPGESTYTKP
jgi:transcriptional regulator with XRE-family HTH domain